jgi:hypothetical protein
MSAWLLECASGFVFPPLLSRQGLLAAGGEHCSKFHSRARLEGNELRSQATSEASGGQQGHGLSARSQADLGPPA